MFCFWSSWTFFCSSRLCAVQTATLRHTELRVITQTKFRIIHHKWPKIKAVGSAQSPVFQSIHVHLLLLTALLSRLLVADFPPDSLQRALFCLLNREKIIPQNDPIYLIIVEWRWWNGPGTTFASFSSHYLCEGHVCGNSGPLFGQKSLLLFGEHNLFKLELGWQITSVMWSEFMMVIWEIVTLHFSSEEEMNWPGLVYRVQLNRLVGPL